MGGGDISGALDVLCPMHALLDAAGRVASAGPTLRRLVPVASRPAPLFLDLFEMTRPRGLYSMAQLHARAGQRLRLQLRAPPRTVFTGVAVPWGDDGGALVNLSFGVRAPEAVAEHGLTLADFAPTDLTVEMLYLVEAKSAAMALSRDLNRRLQAARVSAEEQAFTDTLTGLKNRRALTHVVPRLAARRRPFALMQLDLDRFKQVNDTLGHAAGDEVLQRVAAVLVDEIRADDIAVRIGGDEFLLVFDALPVAEPAAALLDDIAARIIARLEQPMPLGGGTARISASAGSTLSELYHEPGLARMMDDADVALYAAKRAGRGRHRLYTPALRAIQPVCGARPDVA